MTADADAIRSALAAEKSAAVLQRVTPNPNLPAGYPPFMIAKRVIPFELETRHVLMVGTTGAGKTLAIKQVLETAFQREAPVVMIDHGGEMIQYYYREGVDIILNPMDARSVGWSPFNEAKRISDFKRIAKLIITDTSNNQDWTAGAQQVFADVLRKLWKLGPKFRRNRPLLYFLLNAPLRGVEKAESLEWLLAGTPSARLFEEGNEKQLAITMGIISRYIEPLTYLSEGDFSITDHVKSFETKGVCRRALFLSYTDENHSAISPLMSMWMEFAVQAGLSLSESPDRRFYLVFDELGSLHPMRALPDALAKIRKPGGVVICGLQSSSQIEDDERYGEKGAQSLLSCFGTILMLRVSDDETAEKMSRILGDIRMTTTSISTSATGEKSTTEKQEVERLVLASNFTRFADRTGILRIAGDRYVYRIGTKPHPTHPKTEPDVLDPDNMVPISTRPKVQPKEITRPEMSLEWLDAQAALMEPEIETLVA